MGEKMMLYTEDVNIDTERGLGADKVGHIFSYKDEWYRGIYPNMENLAKNWFSSGLIKDLENKSLIPKTSVADVSLDGYAMVLCHEKILQSSVIHEWTFDMIKDAALMILDLWEVLLAHGYTVHDPHPWNILFHNNRPVYADISSFVPSEEIGSFSIRVFFRQIYQVVEMMSYSVSGARDRILARKNLGIRHNLEFFYGIKKANYCLRYSGRYTNLFERQGKRRDEDSIHRVLDTYRNHLNKFVLLEKGQWSEYGKRYIDEFCCPTDVTRNRFRELIEQIRNYEIHDIIEFGSNNGALALALALAEEEQINKIIATDCDEFAINDLYCKLKSDVAKEIYKKKIFPLWKDFNAEQTGDYMLGARSAVSRMKSDAVIACAVTHHWMLTQGMKLDRIIEKLCQYSRRYIFVEFMPLGLYGGGGIPLVPDWYTEKYFRKSLEKRCHILSVKQTDINRILFVCEIK